MTFNRASRPLHIPAQAQRWKAQRWKTLYDGTASLLIAFVSFVRGLPLFVSARPKTPLRVLCIMAFDTLHRLREGKRLPTPKRQLLAVLLDFGACANAALDHKQYCRQEWRRTRQLLEEAGIASSVVEYLRRLRCLESERPLPGGDERQFDRVRLYREAVVRLSLAVVAATADGTQNVGEKMQATESDADLNLLFRIVMQCQIVDDVLDYKQDLSAGLPSFLTATRPLPRALELTRSAARAYADVRDLPQTGDQFSLRAALFLVSACTNLLLCLGGWRLRAQMGTAVWALEKNSRGLTDQTRDRLSSVTATTARIVLRRTR
jgi:hypothetical protein